LSSVPARSIGISLPPDGRVSFSGDRAGVLTMEMIVRVAERKYGRARRIWVFDHGVTSEQNLQTVRREKEQAIRKRSSAL